MLDVSRRAVVLWEADQRQISRITELALVALDKTGVTRLSPKAGEEEFISLEAVNEQLVSMGCKPQGYTTAGHDFWLTPSGKSFTVPRDPIVSRGKMKMFRTELAAALIEYVGSLSAKRNRNGHAR